MISPEQFESHEERVAEIARNSGWHPQRYDTQLYYQTTRDNIHKHGLETNIRHSPDLLLSRPGQPSWLIECKSVSPKHRNSPNYSIEKASLHACCAFQQIERVLIVWDDLSATPPRDVLSLPKQDGPCNGGGSDDPYHLINRVELAKISRPFVDYLIDIAQ